jgi:hypothetical protein
MSCSALRNKTTSSDGIHRAAGGAPISDVSLVMCFGSLKDFAWLATEAHHDVIQIDVLVTSTRHGW